MTATLSRTDIHRPSAAVYGDYVFLTDFYQGASDEVWRSYRVENREHARLLDAGPRFEGNYSAKGTCDHCGATFSYGACFRHRATGELVNFGHTCGRTFLTAEERKAIDLRHARALKAQEREREQAKFLAENPGAGEAIEYLRANDRVPFYASLLQAFRDHYTLTPKQLAAAISAKVRDEERAAAQAARAAAQAATVTKSPVPEGDARVTVTGTVVSVKEVEDPFRSTRYYSATTLKLLVEDDRGFRVYGTCPTSLEFNGDNGIAKGARITFQARLQRSEKDESFGFYSRPTQARVL